METDDLLNEARSLYAKEMTDLITKFAIVLTLFVISPILIIKFGQKQSEKTIFAKTNLSKNNPNSKNTIIISNKKI